MNPNISIIIPAYNRENTIKIALDSLLNQTYQNFEVIIIDDGSIDKTANIVKKYNDIKFKYHFQENAGVSVARNRGIELAKGEFICFLDSDDFYEQTFLEKMYTKILNESSDICYCGYFKKTPQSKTKCRTLFKSGDILVGYLLGNINIHTTGWMIKKDIIESNNVYFTENLSWGEDMEFFSELLSRTNNICYVEEYLTNYVIGDDNNKLSSFSLDKLDKDFDFINRLIIKLKADQTPSIKKALLDYRFPALITYRLRKSIDIGLNKREIKEGFDKYKKYIFNISFNNGLRSIKLNVNKIILIYKIYKLKKL